MLPLSPAPRVIRGVASGLMATFVALLSHVAAGGAVPSARALVLPAILAVVASVWIGRRELSFFRVACSVAASQAVFHGLFTLGGHDMAHHAGLPMWTMWIAHALAAVVTVALLYRGERAVQRVWTTGRRLVTWIGRRWFPRGVVLGALPAAPNVPGWIPAAPIHTRIFAAVVSRRGPPVLA